MTPSVVVADALDEAVSPDDEESPSTPQDEAKPKNTVDDQLNKAVEVLKSKAS